MKCCIQLIKKLTSYSQPSKKERKKDAVISVPQKYFSIGEGSSDTGWFDGKLRIYNSVLFCISYVLKLQSTLGFETLDKAAALGLETATPLTDLRQYINSNLGFSNLKI